MEVTGTEIVCRALEAEGIRYVFGNPGSTEIPLLEAFAARPGLEYVLALHEGSAVAMADGYARASGTPGIVSVHACPGTAHSLGNLYNACIDGVPVIALAGQQDSRMLIREPFLSADLARLAEQFTKWSYEVTRIEELPIALRRAFKEATSAPAGPVFLSLPKNVLDETIDAEVAPRAKNRVGSRGRGDVREMRRAAELLATAQRPTIITGIGVARSGAIPELVELAEVLAARVYGDPSSFPTGHKLYFGAFDLHQLTGIVRTSDLLMVVGGQMFSELVYTPDAILPAGVKAIHLHENPWEVGKNQAVDVGIVADPKLGLRELVDELRGLMLGAAGQNVLRRWGEIERMKEEERRALAEQASQWEGLPLRVGRVVWELRDLLSNDAIVVEEGLASSGYLKKCVEFNRPGSYYGQTGGTLGWGLGAAVGVKMAQPGRQVVAFVGDGSAMYGVQALWTAGRRNIPVTILLMNNGGYMAVKSLSVAYGGEWAKRGKFVGADIGGIDYVKVAEGLGVPARRVERPEDIRSSLEWGLNAGRPALIELVVDPKDAGYGRPRLPS